MPNETFNKKNYIKYRWTPEQSRFERYAQLNQRLNIATTILTIVAAVGTLIFTGVDQTIQMSLFSLTLVSLSIGVLYDFKDRARRYRGLSDALRREREMLDAEAGAYVNTERAFARFVRRCETIIQSSGDSYTPLLIEEDEPDTDVNPPSDEQEDPFSAGNRLSSLRNRLSSGRFSSAPGPKQEKEEDNESNETGDSSSQSRFGSNPFGSRSSSSPFGSRPPTGSSPFSRSSSNSPFGSSSRFAGGRPIGSSGGLRREGQDDPALAGLNDGNGNTGVRFSVYYPKELTPNEWHPLKAYAFMGYAMEAVTIDAEGGDPEKVPQILYDRNRNPRYRIPEGAQVTVTPHMKGFQFNPQSVSIGFYRTWHRFDFELRAMDARMDEATNGYLTFTVDGLVIADVPMSIYVAKGVSKDRKNVVRRVTRKPYRAIYPCFADEDRHLAERFRRVFDALGIYTMRDLMQIRTENGWTEEHMKGIDEAEVFQLFWSESAANSNIVAQELRYAQERSSDINNFIRAVYWEQPPAALPEELHNVKADYIPDIAE